LKEIHSNSTFRPKGLHQEQNIQTQTDTEKSRTELHDIPTMNEATMKNDDRKEQSEWYN